MAKDLKLDLFPEDPPSIVYHSRDHAAVRTEDFVFSQLIPYIGNKRKLLPLIANAVASTGVIGGVFADLFAGSGVVSRWAKQDGFRVVANDWEPYAEQINGCHIGLNAMPAGVAALLNELNDPDLVADGYVTRHYCPADDENVDPERERCFYTRANGRRLDAIRERIAGWEKSGVIDAQGKAYLLAPLLYAASYVSNTSGVFKAYHNGWGGQTSTALYRILSDIRLCAPVLYDNGLSNVVTRCDAQVLACDWREIISAPLDIAYLDPPYNQHPYGSNYHVLNTVALWDSPPIDPIGPGSKSAIRTDWRTERRSAYNHRVQALPALTRLVDALPCRWVLLSYSTDGNMSTEALLSALAERGATHIVTQRYKRYRVSTQRMSARPHTVEFVVVLDKSARPRPELASEHLETLAQAGTEIEP
jgi:adenine-specific DNA-methyltransferase